MSVTVDKLLDLARSQIGIKESPAGSNKVKYNTWYYGSEVSGSQYPWCVTFVAWLFNELGASKLFFGGAKTASSSTLYRYHAESGQAVTDGKYKPGDIIYFMFDGNGHTGVCERFDGSNITTIDGNTGTTNEANGGAVMRRTRNKKYIKGAWRPRYEESEEMPVTYQTISDIPAWGKPSVQKLIDKKYLVGDEKGEIGVTIDMLRMIVINDRAGLYD